ncbi:hypothetical protein RvY_05550-4 [Ramazzottius varieornatus]|uniref:Transmembrane protein n=1 Tax=Ramazzottius varieornatus TaxID=947166 RepID=A0A1D1UYH1_RAMVA|nr:hypothetical protein RvY_05550-4 [Ramazzottius varieornatus]
MWITPIQEFTDKISGSSTTYTRTATVVLDPDFLAVQDTAVLVDPAEVTVAVHQAAQATRVAVLGTLAVVRTTEDPTVLVVVAWPTVPVPTYTEVSCRNPRTWRPLRQKLSPFEKFCLHWCRLSLPLPLQPSLCSDPRLITPLSWLDRTFPEVFLSFVFIATVAIFLQAVFCTFCTDGM